jgi:uncharacterized membrane protein
MSKRKQEEKHMNAKQRAHEQKEAAKAEKVVKWIFGLLVGFALLWLIYTIWLAA